MPSIQLTLLFPAPLQVSGTFSQWKMIVQMCQWFWKCDYKFTYIQSTNSISMHTTQTHGYVPISATSTTMRPLPYANIFIHIDEHVRREIMNHRSLKHPNIIRSKEMQMDEHVQREIINHKSLKNPNIIRFKELLLSIRQH